MPPNREPLTNPPPPLCPPCPQPSGSSPSPPCRTSSSGSSPSSSSPEEAEEKDEKETEANTEHDIASGAAAAAGGSTDTLDDCSYWLMCALFSTSNKPQTLSELLAFLRDAGHDFPLSDIDTVLGGLAFESTGMGEHARYHAGDSSYEQFTERFASVVVDWYTNTTDTVVKQTDIGYLLSANAHFGKMCHFCHAGVKSMIKHTKNESYFVILAADTDMVDGTPVHLRSMDANDTLMCTRCHGFIDDPEPDAQDTGRRRTRQSQRHR